MDRVRFVRRLTRGIEAAQVERFGAGQQAAAVATASAAVNAWLAGTS